MSLDCLSNNISLLSRDAARKKLQNISAVHFLFPRPTLDS